MAELVIHVPNIDESGKDYAFELKPSWLETTLRDAGLRPDPQYGPGVLSVHAQQNGNEYLVTGTLRAHLVTECGRCLGDAPVPVEATFGTLFNRVAGKTKAKLAPREPLELDEDDDELEREDFSGYDIVLDELVREHLVLEMPMQPLCSEACQGIPVPKHVRPPEDAFAKPGDVNPRLAPLQRLRDNVPPEAESAPRRTIDPEQATPAKSPERSDKRSSNKE